MLMLTMVAVSFLRCSPQKQQQQHRSADASLPSLKPRCVNVIYDRRKVRCVGKSRWWWVGGGKRGRRREGVEEEMQTWKGICRAEGRSIRKRKIVFTEMKSFAGSK